MSLNTTLASAAGETIYVMCRVHNWMRAAIMVPAAEDGPRGI